MTCYRHSSVISPQSRMKCSCLQHPSPTQEDAILYARCDDPGRSVGLSHDSVRCSRGSPNVVSSRERDREIALTIPLLNRFEPINQIHQHLCGLHVYAHDPDRAVEAHHFCTHLTPDMHQCIIYDGPGPKARLIGKSDSGPHCRANRGMMLT